MKICAALLFLAAFALAACSSPPSPNTATSPAPQTQIVQALSPAQTMNALNEAARKKDTETLKQLISKGTLALMEANAREQKVTVDELLKRDDGAPFEELPEMRNERVAGERATIEIKSNVSQTWVTLPFIKEDGGWKIALDEYAEQIRQQMNEEMTKPPAANGKAPKAK